ncbi:MAG: multicomponent Na+:H+ antiporter subunit D [Paracoccaceae bacterium]|jgi:multicomponent Na+:H+ antiporter subunit D
MTPDLLIVASLLLPVIGAIVSLALRGHAAPVVVTAVLGFASAIALVATTADGSVEALHVGNWPAPFGIVLVADGFAALMLAVCQLVLVASMIFSITTLPAHFKRRHLFPLLSTLSLGANGAFLTGDLFNLYVWFEVLLLSSFSIMAMVPGAAAKQATWRYVVINLVASLLFLIAAGLIYGKTGTLNFADLHLRFQSAQSSFLIESSTALLFGAFGIKAALIPLAFWLPKSYPQLPPALAALFAALLTKIGLYAFYRVFGMVLVVDGKFPHQDILFWLAIITMVGGVLGAIAQSDMRRILSFHIISQVGYMALALALFSPLAMAAGVFYLIHHIIVKGNLFLVTDLVEKHAGTSRLADLSGVVRSSPLIAALFAIPALSLAGLPPLSGFFAKFALLKAGLELHNWIAAVAIVSVGLLTIFSMLKIWVAVFWGPAPSKKGTPPRINLATSATLALVTLAIGIGCGPFFELTQNAANSLTNPAAYLEAVLGAPNPVIK